MAVMKTKSYALAAYSRSLKAWKIGYGVVVTSNLKSGSSVAVRKMA